MDPEMITIAVKVMSKESSVWSANSGAMKYVIKEIGELLTTMK
eukprot:CAMPEP_0170533918 /NCGR_PEP_ID=MMETSP0209-20121228/86242_1 /TAXON_ID=665100 ORGANISM="Litonotus pictus, Strain P1" /NCGR_SAMPLE_ID=MMETSP0209 /ASSEMBLY_ACC=CAM_ASM_000301 /LENGTH=42 /DNA_ID= /DNA_START= /DNA_END= /DNA_ORIENTATION=